jgi:hypothetical protein
MRGFLIGAIGLSIVGFASPSYASGACSDALQALGQQWDAMGFTAPQKPSQAYVYGHAGHVISGMDYQRVTGQMRAAAEDCRAGQEDAAMQRIQSIQATLSPSHNG